MSTANNIVVIVAIVILVGLILRYGNSSNALAKDLNSILGTLTLQGPNVGYYGPNS